MKRRLRKKAEVEADTPSPPPRRRTHALSHALLRLTRPHRPRAARRVTVAVTRLAYALSRALPALTAQRRPRSPLSPCSLRR